jgi:hypothetical protein
MGKSERKIPLGGYKYSSKNIIKMGLGEIGWVVKDWIHLTRDRDPNRLLCT